MHKTLIKYNRDNEAKKFQSMERNFIPLTDDSAYCAVTSLVGSISFQKSYSESTIIINIINLPQRLQRT